MASNIDLWITRLKNAFSGIGTDEDEVYDVLTKAKGQISLIVKKYPGLEDELYDELSGDELKKALHLFYEVSLPPSPDDTEVDDTQWVSTLYEAFNSGGFFGGTDEDKIMSVLQAAKKVSQIGALTNFYNKQHSDDLSLEDELYDELSGEELKQALRLYYTGFTKKEPTAVKVDATLTPRMSKPAVVAKPVKPDPAPEPVAPVETGPGFRPGYIGHEMRASSPGILDFAMTDTVLANLTDEKAFRKIIVETSMVMDNLGLNREHGEDRAKAYLDMATWDENYRTSWTDDNSENSSSCGMYVRNILWLCGMRGKKLTDENYTIEKRPYTTKEGTTKYTQAGVLTYIIEFEPEASKSWGSSGCTSKTFFPKPGDILYLYDAAQNSQHIFIICSIDKEINMVDGISTVFDDKENGKLANVVEFVSIDGGQLDGVDKKKRKWGCQAIKKASRKMTLVKGHFPNLGNGWPRPNQEAGRPVNTWIDVWAMRKWFTANYIKPIRKN